MNTAIIEKDTLIFRRQPYLFSLLLITALLVVVSLLIGLQRENVFAKEKAAAMEVDKAVWMNQGDRNPHSAAHFSRYAFRPASALSLLDPGTHDYAGLAIWMEAHYQDPAVFRRAEDGGELSRHIQLTPSFLVLVVAPLLIFLMLHASVAGEREDGTLRQLLSTGVSAKAVFAGKLAAGLRLVLKTYSVIFVPVALIAVAVTPGEVTGDTFARLALLYLTYALYVLICASVAVGVSALFRTRQSAFLALVGVWVLMMVFVPRFSNDVSTRLYPQPDAREASSELSAASNAYYVDKERQRRIETDVLQRHGVTSVDELPFNYGAYVLQVSEELSEPEFDRFYQDLSNRYAAQKSVIRWFSALTPAIAATNLSRGIAGTDRLHQRAFADAAEAHRREMIKLLNEDYMYNAGEAGPTYQGNAGLWSRFEDLDYTHPSMGRVGLSYWSDALVLLLWSVGSLGLAYLLVCRGVRGEVPTS